MPVSSDDPLDEVLRPPPDETSEERQIRESREAEARRISQAIDASIKAERAARRKRRIVRLLLLGQSESGKSTTLRQFQRLYTPTAFREERILWRAVIQLNIVRSIRTIIEALSSPMPNSPYSSPRSRARSISRTRHPPFPPNNPHYSPQSHAADSSSNNGHANGSRSNGHGNGNGDLQFSYGGSPSCPPPVPRQPRQNYYSDPDIDYDPDSDTEFTIANTPYPHGSPNYANGSPRSHPSGSSTTTLAHTPFEVLKARLLPLQHIEALLIAKLVPPNEEEATQLAGPGAPSPTDHSYRSQQEIFVRPGPGWKGGLSRARVHFPGNYEAYDSPTMSNGHRPMSAGNTGLETPDEPQEVLHSCRKDMIQLWGDENVRDVLRRRKIRLEEGSGFFLDDLERVTALRYMPTDDDVLKARLKTVGVSEYKFEMEISAGRDSGTEWRIVDVGGSRSQRPTWAPFFDDVDAIIFLAPISGFDQVLSEDRTVNRLEDSVLLWKAVCSSKLLANVDLVLFLNKCDLLEKKLNSGIRLAKYVRSYGDRPNDLDSVSKYLRGKFSAIHREYSPNPRKFYAFCTSVTDTATTAGIIASVRDMVIRQHLKQSKLL
ncbi:G-alpha-domain-containing protein [Pholiota conissans]|uniref:G-alpha-domain-containing protein n=1 Tax=Pholiota conissans TaxID=109636 RepID=A0A9P6CY46_9AGAR|nr:G-alpha-domain-containing protein [Pholiota conissans]